MISKLSLCAVGALALSAAAGSASAALIQQGTYALHNHPDGNARPPSYGAKLNELYNATSNLDIFTFDFDAPGADMKLIYNGTSIRITGQAWGGRDIGDSYAADQYRGMYTFNFVYVWGVGLAAGDDDLQVDLPTGKYNYGTLVTPLGDTVQLRDGHYGNGQPDFRFGDEDNDLGHRGFNGLSGWGWLFKALPGEQYTYTQDSDWLFTATLIPTPGTGALALTAGAMLLRRRR
jgi:uncharacterized protein (TIGR03382 family)